MSLLKTRARCGKNDYSRTRNRTERREITFENSYLARINNVFRKNVAIACVRSLKFARAILKHE